MSDAREDQQVPPVQRRASDASMTLLNEVIRRPLDPGYAMAASRRERGEQDRLGMGRRVSLMLLAIVLGVATFSAAFALRAPEPSVLAAREILEKEITERTAAVEAQRQSNAEMSQHIAELQKQVLVARDSPLVGQLAVDAAASGVSPLTGPGVRITLTDAPVDEEADEIEQANSRVQDVDLQIVVNGLWAAGAEAISVNGQRLTSTTAIRSAGGAILVNLNPLSGPYLVEAIGDPEDLQTGLARTTAGQHLADLRTMYQIGVKISPQKSVELPASSIPELHSAGVPAGVPIVAGETASQGGPVGDGNPPATMSTTGGAE